MQVGVYRSGIGAARGPSLPPPARFMDPCHWGAIPDAGPTFHCDCGILPSMIVVNTLHYQLPNKRRILDGIDFHLRRGGSLAVLGENGAGKTSLLDILMGFRRRTGGSLDVMGKDPQSDPWETRARIAYLSEKVDMPGDWETREFLAFHREFYPHYDVADERRLMDLFGVRYEDRVGNMSAGEIRRVQIVGALATQPELVIADEITAVLDIQGRKRFLDVLKERQKGRGLTVVLATNVPESLDPYVDHVFLIHRGQQIAFSTTAEFLNGASHISEAVLQKLESR